MSDWIKQKGPLAGSVFFRGNLAPRAEEFAFLRDSGVELKRVKAGDEQAWKLLAAHPKWGRAEIMVLRGAPMPPTFLIDLAFSLNDEEKATLKAAGTAVTIRLAPTGAGALRQRKNLLHYLGAMLGNDGVGACDHSSQQFWSRAGLDDELQHDADVDIEALFTVHAVYKGEEEAKVTEWLHTHGLDGVGAFDFDLLNITNVRDFPGEFDLVRAIVFGILEGEIGPSSDNLMIASPGGRISMVPVPDFDKRAAPGHKRLRESDEDHTHNRSVVCDPRGGFFGKLLRKPHPSRFFAREDFEGTLVGFSERATTLMGERARNTYSVFRAIVEQHGDLQLPTLVKLGLPTSGGGREHPWFEVHAANERDIDCTLINEPFDIPGMTKGDRRRHEVGALTDWAIMTPVGMIKPYRLYKARALPLVREMLKEAAQT